MEQNIIYAAWLTGSLLMVGRIIFLQEKYKRQ